MTRPITKVTQVRPRKVSITENSSPARWRRTATVRRAAALSTRAGGTAAVTDKQAPPPPPPLLHDRAVEVEVLEDAGLEASHAGPRRHLVGVLEHDDERPLE